MTGPVVNRSVRHMNNYFCRKLLRLRQSLSDLKFRLRIPAFVSKKSLSRNLTFQGMAQSSDQSNSGCSSAFGRLSNSTPRAITRASYEIFAIAVRVTLDHVTIHAASITAMPLKLDWLDIVHAD